MLHWILLFNIFFLLLFTRSVSLLFNFFVCYGNKEWIYFWRLSKLRDRHVYTSTVQYYTIIYTYYYMMLQCVSGLCTISPTIYFHKFTCVFISKHLFWENILSNHDQLLQYLLYNTYLDKLKLPRRWYATSIPISNAGIV